MPGQAGIAEERLGVRNTLRGFMALSPLTAVTVVTALIQAKVLAVLLGPEGTGFYALVFTFAGTFATIAGLGISAALMKLIAEFGAADRDDDIWPTVILGFATVTVAGLAVLAVVLIAFGPLSSAFLNDASLSASDQRFVLIAAAASALPLAWVPTLSGVLRGLRSLREYVAAGLFGAIVPMIGLVVGAWQYDARGAFIGYIAGQVLGVVAGLVFVLKVARDRKISFRVRLPVGLLRGLEGRLVALGLIAVVAALANAVGQPIIRTQIAGLDLRALGFFAAAWSLSNRVPVLIYQTMTAYVLPEISAMQRDWREIVRLQNDACRISLLIATPLLCGTAAAAPWIVPILFSHSFSPVVELLQLMLIGELLSVVVWASVSAFYPSGRGGLSIASEWWFWGLFTLGSVIAVSLGSLNAVGGAYIIAEAVLAASAYIWERRHHGFRWRNENARLIALSLATMTSIVLVAILTNLPTLVVLMLATVVLAAWAFVVVQPSEWIALRRLLARARHGAS
jgi:antigen flippase